MLGLMQQRPLLISNLVDYAADWHGGPRDRLARPGRRDPSLHLRRGRRSGEAAGQCAGRARPPARRPGRDARLEQLSPSRALLWGHVSGRVLHTVNPRLFPEQLSTSSTTPKTRYVFFDPVFAPLVEDWRRACRTCAAGCRSATAPALRRSRSTPSRLRGADRRRFARIRLAAVSTRTPPRRSATPRARPAIRKACSTAIARPCCTPSPPVRSTASGSRDAISFLVVVPLFHANAWSVPFSGGDVRGEARAAGAAARSGEPVHPDDGGGLHKSGGVPTVWLNFLAWIEANRDRLDLSRLKLKTVLCGGSAPPRAIIEKFHDLLGVDPAARLGHDRDEPDRDDRRAAL